MTPADIEALIDAVPMPLITIGADARIEAINAPAAELFGRVGQGRHYSMQLRQPSVAQLIENALGPGHAGQARIRRVEGEGEQIFSVRATPLKGRVMLAFEDLSQTEAAQQIRRDFVANVSHELKTPLTALMGFIETLRGPARNDETARERFLAIMERETARMNRLVNDLLSLSRVEAVARQRPSDEVDVPRLLASALNALRPIAEEAGVEVVFDLPEDLPPVPGDADQLTQVFTNLIENALKYGASGKRIEVRVTREERVASLKGPALRCEVRDFGYGIDPIHIPRLTERFYRVDSHRSREMGGTGLGLAIAKHIIARHRGRFAIESKPGEGARFTVFLPVGAGQGG
ncbi:sensor histidine kinase [Vannielia litorea]|uniref:histidine kinase n=1 Tax=Vannielia litorea TaxID=1217970 RepID=A0A1N6EXU8_9RHOB|nr:ATP-binding protein [Vannielia litorea]SIN87763.1 two-component system, OmpR family, phosphate regulon sensor histidine kinase PhoR [Vannielia litorea]